MAHDVDGFVIPLRKDKIDEYRSIAEKAGRSCETIVPWNIGNASVTTSTSRGRYHSRS